MSGRMRRPSGPGRLRPSSRSGPHRVGPGGQKLAYVEGAWVIRQLNLAFGWDWDLEIRDREVITDPDGRPQEVVVLGRLSCRLPDGRVVVKEDFGSDVFKAGVQAGDVFKSAATDALKRCARALGIALDLYERTGTAGSAASWKGG